MIKRAAFLVLMVLFLALVSNTLAATRTWDAGGGADRSWTNSVNWSSDTCPTIADEATLNLVSGSSDGPLVNTATAVAFAVRVGGPVGGATWCTLTIADGGVLNVAEWIMAGTDSTSSRSGVLNMTGGVLNLGVVTANRGHLNIGHTSSATKGFLYMTGGTINASATLFIAKNDGTTGEVHLDGGTIYASTLTMASGVGCTASMDITGSGKLILIGDDTAVVAGYIAAGWLTGNGNNYEIHYDYNITNSGKTTVWAATGEFLHWEGFANFGPIALENIGNRNQVREGYSSLNLTLNGNATISADNSAAAQLTHTTSGDTLVTEYKLTFDGDGDPNTGGETVDWTPYNDFLTTPSDVTYFTGDEDVEVTLHVRASNAAGTLADAGTYTATQTLTASWNP